MPAACGDTAVRYRDVFDFGLPAAAVEHHGALNKPIPGWVHDRSTFHRTRPHVTPIVMVVAATVAVELRGV